MSVPTQFVSLNAVLARGWSDPQTGKLTREAMMKLQEWDNKLKQTLDLLGQLSAATKISGRTEGIGTTVQNLDSAGVTLPNGVDLSRAYLNKNTDNISDGTGSPLAGGKRGFVALDTNSRLASGFYNNPVNASGTPTASSVLSNDGLSTLISVGAWGNQFDFGTVSYNSGTVDPGGYGTWYIYFDDPTFAGGAVVYQASSSPLSQTAAKGRVPVGVIKTVAASAETGGGFSGGSTTGGIGGRGYVFVA